MSGTYRMTVVEDAAAVASVAADEIVDAIAEAIAARGTCSLTLAGGSSPKATYRLLAEADIDWSRVHIYFGDERCVPPEHPESNFGMAHAALLAHVPLPEANVHRVEAERKDPETAAEEYDRALPDSLDILLLGMGEDAHTASIFPGNEAVHESSRRVELVVGPKPPPRRLTLTPAVITAARHVIVLTAGASKADALHDAIHNDHDPVRWPIQLARHGHFIVDRAAASRVA